ncbi:Rib/alpha-like domain-containing protein [Corynebacterium urinipleomorphum]|uniref:Rib/alpha-like domain-containing protein n=1 Tax=Corynebacterium urinipleomorphum TaxID=1852380 RepID=UPI000B361C75|nr:Rib/alpha-like domain-containing protein [Corynebacterium urinipleomorphum]
MSRNKSTTVLSRAVAIALAAGLVAVPHADAQQVKTTTMEVPMGCNLQIKKGDLGLIAKRLVSGGEGVYNGGNRDYQKSGDYKDIRIRPQVTAPTEVEKGKQFDYVIDLGKVGTPAKIGIAAVKSADQLNFWLDLPKNAKLDAVKLEGGSGDVAYTVEGNRIRFHKKGAEDVSKWIRNNEAQWNHGGLTARRQNVNGVDMFVVDMPKITLKLTPTGEPGAQIQPYLDTSDPAQFPSKAFAQLYANADAAGTNADAFVRCGLSETDTTNHPKNNAVRGEGDKFPIVRITPPSNAGIYDPQPKAPVTITQGDALPEAKDQIADFASLPAGTTAAWASAHQAVGDTQSGKITVTYPDKSTDTVNIPVTVKAPYVPEPKTNPTTVQVGTSIADQAAKAQIGNANSAPEGTTFTWKTKPDTRNAAESVNGVVTVTVPGKSPVDVTVKYTVQEEEVKWAPEVAESVAEVEEGAAISDEAAKAWILNAASAPQGTTFTWKSKPDTATTGTKTGVVTVTAPGEDPVDLTVQYDVKAKPQLPQPDEFIPEAKITPTEVEQNSTIADDTAKAQVTDADKAPAGTTFTWKSKPDTTTTGEKTGVVTVTIPGKDPQDIEVKYTVKAPGAGTNDSEQPQQQGERTVVVKGAKTGDTVRVDGNSDVITADADGRFAIPESWIPAGGKFDVVVTGADGNEVVYTVDVEKGTATKKPDGKKIAGAVLGSLASVAVMIAGFLPIPGLKEMITNLQRQIGVFDPQLAGMADKALPIVSTIVGIVGLGVSIGTAIDKVKVEIQDSNGESIKPSGSSRAEATEQEA